MAWKLRIRPPMPRVIHVLRKFEPSEWGGLETHLLGLIPALARLGWESEVHAPAESGTDGRPIEAAGARFRTFRAYYPCLRMRPADRAAMVASGGNLVAPGELASLLLQRHASVLHVHSLRRLGGVVRTASRLTRTPYAVTVHAPTRGTGGESFEREGAKRARELLDVGAPFGWVVGARRVVRDADVVFTLNDVEHAAWLKSENAPRQLVRLPHGIDPRRATDTMRANARAAIPGLGAAPFALVLARIDPVKGQDIALEAFLRADVRHVHLVFAGAEVDAAFARRLRSQAASLGSRVHFVGNVRPSLARALLAESAIVLVPSRAEALGLVLAEAWAEGACALFSDVDGLHALDVAVGGTPGRIEGGSADTWVHTIRGALAGAGEWKHEADRGPERVARCFSWDRVAERVAENYRTLATRTDGASR